MLLLLLSTACGAWQSAARLPLAPASPRPAAPLPLEVALHGLPLAPVSPLASPRPALTPRSRSPPPRASIAFEAVKLNLNPISITIVIFTLAWAASPIIATTSLREADWIQKGNKMRMMDKSEPPRVRGKRLSPEAVEITRGFQRDYDRKELELLWGALLNCYGSESLAVEAARANPQILNPSYSFCNTLIESKKILLEAMSKDEALEVMLQNPAVLQCGPSLDGLGATEIQGFASLRSLGNRLVPPEARGALLGGLFVLVGVALVGDSVPELAPVIGVVRPLVGAVLASSFLFAAYGAAKSG